MTLEVETINGVNIGIEFFDDDVYGQGMLIDLVFFRFLITWSEV